MIIQNAFIVTIDRHFHLTSRLRQKNEKLLKGNQMNSEMILMNSETRLVKKLKNNPKRRVFSVTYAAIFLKKSQNGNS